MTQNFTPDPPDPATTTNQPVDEGAPPAVSAFVAAAITEHRRNHGFDQLLADLGADDGQPTAGERGWARGTLGVS